MLFTSSANKTLVTDGNWEVRGHLHRVPSYHTLRMIANSWWNLVPNSGTNKTTGGWTIIKSPTILTSTSDLLRVCIHTAHVPVWSSVFLLDSTRMLCGTIPGRNRNEVVRPLAVGAIFFMSFENF